ncbi:MAG: AMP-binding protein, partial [Pseudomonadota bacterium]
MIEHKPWIAAYPKGASAELVALAHRHVPAMLREAARTYAEQTAFTVCLPNGTAASLSFAEADRLSDAFAAFLRLDLGLRTGDRVGVQMPNGFGYVVAAFGILKAGCVLVNVNPLYKPDETRHQLADAEARALVVIDMFADRLDAETLAGLDHVVLASVVDFFPALKRHLVALTLRYVKRQVPPPRFHHVTMTDAVAAGRRRLSAQPDAVAVFADSLQPESTAALQYTGGTTGVAKGAMLSHRNLIANVVQGYEMVDELVDAGRECCLTALPLYHIFAFTSSLLGMYRAGAHNILIPSPRPVANLRPAFQKYPVTWTSGVNTLFNALNNEPWFADSPPQHLKASIAGGVKLHEDVADRWEALTGSPIVEGYGLTEASPTLTLTPFSAPQRRNTIGVPVPGTDVRLVDDDGTPVGRGTPGELQARGPQVMQGYWKRPEETAATLQDGWLATGDIAVMGDDGFFRIVDRKKDIIIVSGFNVYPNEVEECIAAMEGVEEAAVVGIHDDATGEAVKAFVAASGGVVSED